MKEFLRWCWKEPVTQGGFGIGVTFLLFGVIFPSLTVPLNLQMLVAMGIGTACIGVPLILQWGALLGIAGKHWKRYLIATEIMGQKEVLEKTPDGEKLLQQAEKTLNEISLVQTEARTPENQNTEEEAEQKAQRERQALADRLRRELEETTKEPILREEGIPIPSHPKTDDNIEQLPVVRG